MLNLLKDLWNYREYVRVCHIVQRTLREHPLPQTFGLPFAPADYEPKPFRKWRISRLNPRVKEERRGLRRVT